MRNAKLMFIFVLGIIFMPFSPAHSSEAQLITDEINKAAGPSQQEIRLTQSADSLGIFHLPNERYYIYCSLCPIQTANGFLQMKIIDTLNYVDPNIPEDAWLKAYITGSYTYHWNPKISTIKFENQEFRIDNCWDDTRAVLVGDSLKSVTLTNVTRNDEVDSVSFGKFMIFGLLIMGLLMGLLIKNLKKIQIITFIAINAVVAFFIYIMFNGTLLALSIPLGAFILGNLLTFTVFWVLHSLKRKA